MNTIVRRRAFVGTLVVGLPFVASDVSSAQRGMPRPTTGGRSGFEAELLNQLRDNIRGMQGARRGESARRAAATLRIAAADFASRDLDAQFKAHLRAQVNRDGEAALLTRDQSPSLAEDLRQFGIRRVPPPSLDYASRQQALRTVLANGITPAMMAVANVLDELSSELDALPIIPVSRRAATCPDLRIQKLAVEVMMIAACLFNPITCAIFSGMYAGLMIGLATMGC